MIKKTPFRACFFARIKGTFGNDPQREILVGFLRYRGKPTFGLVYIMVNRAFPFKYSAKLTSSHPIMWFCVLKEGGWTMLGGTDFVFGNLS